MKGSNRNFVPVTIRLPKHLADWLTEFSCEVAMEPSQLIATILTYYYEAWRAGLEKGRGSGRLEVRREARPATLNEIAEDFIKKPKIKNTFLIKKFIKWLDKEGIPPKELSEDIIRKFLEEYKSLRNISKNSIYVYKRTLREFLKYVKAKNQESNIQNKS